jgi:hypothetical protein
MALSNWAVPQLAKLLPIDEDSLKQIVTYTETLSKPAASEHLMNVLGDSGQALEFISSFNNRRPNPQASNPPPSAPPSQATSSSSEVPRPARKPAKVKRPLHALPARQIEHREDLAGAYQKRDEDDYMSGRSRGKEPPLSNTLALQEKPDALQLPSSTTGAPQVHKTSRLPPSAAGALISDMPSAKSSRSSSPAPKNLSTSSKTKISIAGGTSMRGQSTVLNDLDSAIRTLELQTNPSLTTLSPEENARRRCDCMAQRHALLAAAPNCTNCGKIICAKEGLGPCTFCEKPLLNPHETQEMLRLLKEERGRERQTAHNAGHARAEVAKAARPFAAGGSSLSTPGATTPASIGNTPAGSDDEGTANLVNAKAHRDRLLAFQANNAKRTRIHDEAADFETPDAGQSMWSTPQERALQLKRQQKILREQEYAARPEWERKQMVVSIDIKGGKAVKTMRRVERAREIEVEEPGDDDDDDGFEAQPESKGRSTANFSRNPLLGNLIRPVYNRADGESVEKGKGPVASQEKRVQNTGWRRVQDDQEVADNERWILDGGAYGDSAGGNRSLGAEEHAVGNGGGSGYKSQVG